MNAQLQAHIKKINNAAVAWQQEDPEHRGVGLLCEDSAHWTEYGITTPDEFDRYMAYTEYFDSYKSLHGIKPRWLGPWKSFTLAELEAMTAILNKEWEEHMAEQIAAERAQALEESEGARIAGIDVDTYRRWMAAIDSVDPELELSEAGF